MRKYNYVYPFSNENLNELSKLYEFDNKNILTVVGSGDQYFTSMLNEAKSVVLIDNNETAWLYFVLKFYAIRELEYQEFIEMFVYNNYMNNDIYNKLVNVLPSYVLKYFQYIISMVDVDLNNVFYFNEVFRNFINYKDGGIIPYLEYNNFYKLKEILKRTMLPEFLYMDFIFLKKCNSDLMLLSNIYDYLGVSVLGYRKLLDEFNCPVIQANYEWESSENKKFYENGFLIDEIVPGIITNKNYVYSLKKI